MRKISYEIQTLTISTSLKNHDMNQAKQIQKNWAKSSILSKEKNIIPFLLWYQYV